jgi:hypothetical protein
MTSKKQTKKKYTNITYTSLATDFYNATTNSNFFLDLIKLFFTNFYSLPIYLL